MLFQVTTGGEIIITPYANDQKWQVPPASPALPAGGQRNYARPPRGGDGPFAFHFPRPGRRRSSQSIEPHLYYPLAAPGLLQRGDAMTTSARTGAAGVPPSERRRNADGGLTETAAPAERGVPGARIAESARPEPETRCSG